MVDIISRVRWYESWKICDEKGIAGEIKDCKSIIVPTREVNNSPRDDAPMMDAIQCLSSTPVVRCGYQLGCLVYCSGSTENQRSIKEKRKPSSHPAPVDLPKGNGIKCVGDVVQWLDVAGAGTDGENMF